MTSRIDLKKKVFGEIAAARTITDGLPKFSSSSSFSSVNNKANKISFITDILRSLVGYEEVTNTVVEILTNSIEKIERELRTSVKSDIKNSINICSDPKPPAWLFTDGLVIEVKKIDFFDILRIDPTSVGGGLIYTDVTPSFVDSGDFNTFLYGVIQNDGQEYNWPQIGTPIYKIKFNSQGTATRPNNSLTIKLNQATVNNKTLVDINNLFFDTLTLFNTEKIVNQTIDIIFGTISKNVNKSLKQLQIESKINDIIQKIDDFPDDTAIPDTEFLESNKEKLKREQEALKRKNGVSTLKINKNITSSVPIENLTNFKNDISGLTNYTDKKNVITSNLKLMAQSSVVNVDDSKNKTTSSLDFIQKIIETLTKAMVNLVISPKTIIPYVINFKIINEQYSDFKDSIDFITKNKNLINSLVKTISNEIIRVLMVFVMKEINKLVAKQILKITTEKNKTRISQISSLVGIPSNTLRIIQGLS